MSMSSKAGIAPGSKIERIGARQSAARRCPTCSSSLRQVGDPRMDGRGWEYRRRVCDGDGCGWTGIELRAILDNHLMAVIAESLQDELSSAEELERQEMMDVMEHGD